MVNATYVYPNVCEIPQRGGLFERWRLAESIGCEYIEIPADLVKNKDEEKRTGLCIGDFLSAAAIEILYRRDDTIPKDTNYVLHTEPSLLREDKYGVQCQTRLKWYDKEWTAKLVDMVVSISDFLGKPASVVEFHPGDKRNSYEDLLNFAVLLLDKYSAQFGKELLVLLENRTGQFISQGRELCSFWKFVSEKRPDLKNKIGIVLDIQQMYTVTKKNFEKQFETIPSESIKGFHIHSLHRVPNKSDKIPWFTVSSRIKGIRHELLINLEVNHKKDVKPTKDFCQNILGIP